MSMRLKTEEGPENMHGLDGPKDADSSGGIGPQSNGVSDAHRPIFVRSELEIS